VLFRSPAQAEPSDTVTGPYVGISGGGSGFSTLDLSTRKTSSDETDRAFKVIAGYQVTERFGAEAGFVRFGQFQSTFNVAGKEVLQSVDARAVYLAATARLPMGESFALRGRLGLSANEVTGTNLLPTGDSLIGTKTQPIIGFGAEYRLTPKVSLTADYDAVGKLSDKVSGSAVTIGVRASF